MTTLDLWIDFVDPASWIVHRRLRSATRPEAALADVELRVRGREIRPPRTTPLDPDSDAWRSYVASITEIAPDEMAEYRPPSVLPHTRKAHELVRHAAGGDSRAGVESAIFRAALVDGRDIGRVDVLVELAVAAGMDRSETRAVLDVDRYTDDVDAMRATATSQGVVGVPTMVHAGRLLEGVRSVEEIRAWLDAAPEANE